MSRIEDMLWTGETVIWRTPPVSRELLVSAATNFLAVAALPLLMAILDGWDSRAFWAALSGTAAAILLSSLFIVARGGGGVIVTDRRVLQATGIIRPRREELARRYIAGAVVYAGDDTLVLRASRADAIRIVEPDSAASLRQAGTREMRISAPGKNDEILSALDIDAERLEPVALSGAAGSLYAGRSVLGVGGAILLPVLALLGWRMIWPDVSVWMVGLTMFAFAGAGAAIGLWLVWPIARYALDLDSARALACRVYDPEWGAVRPPDELWRDRLSHAERTLSWLYGQPVRLDGTPRPEPLPVAEEVLP